MILSAIFFLIDAIRGRELNLFFLVPLSLGVLCYQYTKTRTLFIENKTVVAKGIFKSNVHEISDFREVIWERRWGYGRNNLRIYFKNGESYSCYPPLGMLFSVMDRLEEINEKIRSMVDL
ncbi:MAG: hypothetical protein JSS76_15810 [Bacteroidetes bacterium]|nr:hypothetical protein [Bacteroidota bacterium]